MKMPHVSIPVLGAIAFLASGAGRVTAQPAAANPSSEIVHLDPFDVTAKKAKGYMATNTISGTAMNTPLKDVPMTINVITSEFLDDSLVGGLLAEGVLDFNSSITQTQRQPVGIRPGGWAIRGFRNRNTLIDGVQCGELIPAYVIDRVEIVKGPNTLYGQSDPGGLINIVTKQPLGVDKATITQKFGTDQTLESTLDFNTTALQKRLGVRLLGAYRETEGWRPADGNQTSFAGLVSNFQLAPTTKVLFHASGSKMNGVPSNRATWSFEVIPTDLNGDGDKLDIVNGVNEATARYNNTFIPRDYTSATVHNWFDEKNFYFESGVRQAIGKRVNVQYMFIRSTQDLAMIFREYNTFGSAPNAPGVSDAQHAAQHQVNKTNVHTLNTHLAFKTGPVAHQVLAGFRYARDFSWGDTWRMRATNAAERAALNNLIATGRNIRLFLTKADVLNRVPIWLDDVPTNEECRTLGTRADTTGDTIERDTNYYLTDSASLLDGRLKLLGGARKVRIKSQSFHYLTYAPNRLNDQRDTSYQAGAVFALTKAISAYSNTATAFNPNGVNSQTGNFYDAERSKAYEFGLKFDDFLNGRISGSVAWFNIDKKNVVRRDFNPVTFSQVTEITDDRARGYDADLFVNLTSNWQTVINYSHLDAHTMVSRTTAKNLRLEGAAPQRLTLWTSYAIEQGPLKGLRFGGGFVWADGPIQQFGTSDNQLVTENGYTVIDLFARYGTRLFERNVTFGLNVDNLNDVFYLRSRAGTNTPRQIMFSVRVDL